MIGLGSNRKFLFKCPVGPISQADADALAEMGIGNNAKAGNFFTVDGNAPRFPSPNDVFPDNVNNTVPFPISIGAFTEFRGHKT